MTVYIQVGAQDTHTRGWFRFGVIGDGILELSPMASALAFTTAYVGGHSFTSAFEHLGTRITLVLNNNGNKNSSNDKEPSFFKF